MKAKTTTKTKGKKATPKKVATKRATSKKTNKTDKKPIKSEKGKGKHRNPNSLANLKTTAGPGRPKGKLNYDTRVELAMEALAHEVVAQHNAKYKQKSKHITIEDVDIEGDIFKQHVLNARKGGRQDIDSFMDRRHGKATSRIELTGKDGDPIAIEQRKAEKKKAARKMLDMWTKKK